MRDITLNPEQRLYVIATEGGVTCFGFDNARDHARLQHTMTLAPHAQRAHPTPEHLWPLMVAAGAAGADVPATRIEGGMTHGVLSMDAYRFGELNVPDPVAA